MFDGGIYVDIEWGIFFGCFLFFFMGVLYFKLLDDKMVVMGCFYVCYMDDWVVLVFIWWVIWWVIKVIYWLMVDLKVDLYLDKIVICRVGWGFDFLGYWFVFGGLVVVWVILERFFEWVFWFYE